MEGVERARDADEQEEKRDARERVSPEPRRQSRWPGWPRLRRSTPSSGTHALNENGRGAPTNRRKSATHWSAEDPSPAAKAVAMDGRRLRRASPSSGTNNVKGLAGSG